MKTTLKNLSVLFVASALIACGGGGPEAKTPAGPVAKPKTEGPTTVSGESVSKSAQSRYQEALELFASHDKAGDWTDSVCSSVAQAFVSAASVQGGKFPEATFNQGLAYARCGNEKDARAKFQQALTEDPKFHHARVQIALYQFRDNGDENAAISALQQAVLDAKFQNVPALVNLAMFQMQRDSQAGGDGCKDDMECAKLNLQRALAIDDAYMPAFNQLALYYFNQAKKRAGAVRGKRGRSIATNSAIGKRADVQQLELAALVCSQAIRKNARYAPVHNTTGLIQNELGQVNGAVREFDSARNLDPKFFEAQMNYALVNLSFRGFDKAQAALKTALDLRPSDYDAHLGMALALRGQITDVNYDTQVTAVQAELDAAKKVDANRPDAYYNEGILTHEYKAKAGLAKDAQIAMLEKAKGIFQTFADKAQGKGEYDGAVKRARERMKDIDDTIQFLKL